METRETINRLNSELKEIQFFLFNLDDSETLSRIDIDILLNKIRNLYEDIFKLKNKPVEASPEPDEDYSDEKSRPEVRPYPYIKSENLIIEENSGNKIEEEEAKEEPVLKSVEIKEPEINPLEPEVEPTNPEDVPLEPEVEPEIVPLEPETEPELEPIEPEKPLIPEIIAEVPKPEPERPVVQEITAEVPKPEPQKPVVQEIIGESPIPEPVKPVEQEIKVEEKTHIEQVPPIKTATIEESNNFGEHLIEISEEFGGIQKKPEIKQTSLFGEPTEVKQSEHNKNKDRKESISEKLQNNQLSVNDVLSTQKKEQNLASQAQHKPITNIRSVISINDRIWFVKELFDNNNDKYNKVVDKINELGTYNEAIDYLSSVFNMTQEKESLNKFIEIVQRRFMGK